MRLRHSKKALLRDVAAPSAMVIALLAILVTAVLYYSTSRSDALAVERQYRRVAVAVQQSMNAIANDQEASTYWDDAVVQLRVRPLDLEWIDNNLGIWFNTYYKHDEAYLLDSANRPVYAMQNGVRASPSSFRRVAEPSLYLAARLRHDLLTSDVARENDRGRTVGASDIGIVAGRPAIVSLKPIISESGEISQKAGSEYLHVVVRYLDGSFLKQLATLYGVDEARFSWTGEGEASLAVRNRHGKIIGHFVWAPFKPGEQVKTRMVPVLIVAFLIIATFCSWLLYRIWRSRLELETSRAQAQHLAFHDSLTGLPNRALFEDRLGHVLTRRDGALAILLLDLDRFKNVNDTLGHQAGDALIQEFALRLSAIVRESDTVARLGGDEFAILVHDRGGTDVHVFAGRILEAVQRPFEIFGSQLFVGVSIGIAMAPTDSREPTELVRKADIALYRAKEEGRNGYRLFSPAMDDTVKLRSTMEEELRQALASGTEFRVHYQPQVRPDGTIIGIEALLRWQHPRRGLISPEQFVPVAEETGLIVPLGEWVLREACTVSRRWPHLFVAVNVSPVQLRAGRFSESLLRVASTTGAQPASIQLEVTERVLLDEDETVRQTLASVRQAGFQIVLDDFGTAYSSLGNLHSLEVDKIKINRSFVQHLGGASDSGAIISAVLALGRAMGLKVAAEGIETSDQQQFLAGAGCDEMQGYLFSKALPEDELALFVGRRDNSAAA